MKPLVWKITGASVADATGTDLSLAGQFVVSVSYADAAAPTVELFHHDFTVAVDDDGNAADVRNDIMEFGRMVGRTREAAATIQVGRTGKIT